MFRFHCDRCKKFIKNVSGAAAKEIDISGEMICKTCQEKEAKLNSVAEKLQRTWDGKMKLLIAEAKKEIISELGKV